MANTIIAKIAARAKVIRKAKPTMSWQTAIKKASAELKGRSKPTTSKRRVLAKKVGVVKTPTQYKGFTINFIRGEYRADSYADGQITDKSFTRLKKKINEYLNPKKRVGVTKSKTEKISNNPYTFDVKAIRSNGTNVMQKRVVYADNIKQAKINLKEFLAEKLGYKKISITNGRFGHEGIPKLGQAKKPISRHKDTKSHNVNIRVMSGTKLKIPKAGVDFNALNGIVEYEVGKFYELSGRYLNKSVVKLTKKFKEVKNQRERTYFYADVYEYRNGHLAKPMKITVSPVWLDGHNARLRPPVKAHEYKKFV